MKQTYRILFLSLLLTFAAGCAKKTGEDADLSTEEKQTTTTVNDTTNRSAAQQQQGITLPLLDAFFADSSFKQDVIREVGLTEDEATKLKQMSREETMKLREMRGDDYTGTTSAAQKYAEDKIAAIIGNEKGQKLAQYLNRRWNGGDVASTPSTSSSADSNSPSGKLNQVPTDTRIVVNAPAYRMDVFDSGQLVRSYTVAIGYPEFPLPAGERQAKEIIFNPTWTPPDELWIDTSSKFTAGKKVEAGSKLNPLGLAKIPIGGPSLIHGGKSEAALGNFGSHGCVGLTDKQMKMFSEQIAQIAGDSLNDKRIAELTKDKKQSKSVKLGQTIPIELRYETIVAENGELHIYRDVYDRGTNTEENARRVLETYGVKYEQLSDSERTQIKDALMAMSTGDSSQSASVDSTKKTTSKSVKTGKQAASKKMRTVTIAALAGKGYPAAILEPKKATTAAATKKR